MGKKDLSYSTTRPAIGPQLDELVLSGGKSNTAPIAQKPATSLKKGNPTTHKKPPTKKPIASAKKKRLTVYLPTDLHRRCKVHSAMNDIDLSAWIAPILEKALDKGAA